MQQRASLLCLLKRKDEARVLLQEAFSDSECAGFGMQLFELCYEQGEYDACAAIIDRVEALQPRADKWVRRTWAARRADIAIGKGELARARSEAEQVQDSVFYRNLAERISQGLEAHRVMLPVGFIRQHWNTCAPATLAALAGYWGCEADHLEIAEAICYDGTPDTSEWHWAIEHGFLATEFSVDWSSACALLDAGVPFTLTTVHTGGGHLQAVIGYDRLRKSLLIRDPFQSAYTEFDVEALFAQHRASGPRGMLVLPVAEAWRVQGIVLPDAAEWALYRALLSALSKHDRNAALTALGQLQTEAPQHRLSLQGARTLAMYDGNEPEILRHTEQLLECFPDDANLQLSKAASLWAVGGRAAHLEWLGQLASRTWADPQILASYADRLAEDGRRLPRALGVTRRALRYAGNNSRVWSQWATLIWQSGQTREALPVYRFASTLNETDEDRAVSYFRACYFLGETEAGLVFLRTRARRLGQKAPASLLTLFEQLDLLERADEARNVLTEAVGLHPQDSELAAYVAEVFLRNGDLENAAALLESCASPLRRTNWLRVTSLLCDARGDTEAALAHAREASALEPLNLRHHRNIASLLARQQGRAAAVAWLKEACTAHPRHYGLHRLYYDWLPDEAEFIERQLRHMAETHPGDVWVLRELATQLTRQQRYEEARRYAAAAITRAPQQAETHGVMGFVLLREQGYAAALPHLQQAVRLNVDYDYALQHLIRTAPDAVQAQNAIDLVRAELIRQVTIGDGLLAFQESAQYHLPPEEILVVLREAHALRGDLWHAWVALGSHLIRMGRADEALPVLEDALARFSMLPRLYVEAAEALKLLGRRDDARNHVARALTLNPAWNRAVRLFVDLVQEEGRGWEEGERVLRHALSRAPEDADLHGLLAWLLEQRGEYASGFETVTASLKLDPRANWVWSCARRLCVARGRLEDFEALVHEVEQRRPGDPWAWMVRAQQSEDDAAALAAAEQALALDPQLTAAWAARCERLLRLKRGAEIAGLLAAQTWSTGVPAELRLWAARARREEDKTAALVELRALLADEPDDYASWSQLADWFDTDDNHQAYVDAAREMLRIMPNAAPAHGYLGHALIKARQYSEALTILRRALEIDPAYAFAALQISDAALLEGNPPEAAVEAAEIVWPLRQLTILAANATRAACRLKDQRRAGLWLERTLEVAGYDHQPTRDALTAVHRQHWSEMVPIIVERCLRNGRCAWEPAVEWVAEQRAKLSLREFLGRYDELLRSDKGEPLCMALIDHAGTRRDRPLFKALLKNYRSLLHAKDSTWGQVSYAMQCFNEYKPVIAWMADWQDRPGAPNWALGSLALAYGTEGNFSAVNDVARRVLNRDPCDQDARLWELVAHAAAGRHAELEQALAGLHEWERESWMKPVLTLLEGYHTAVSERRFFHAIRVFQSIRADKRGLPMLRQLARVLGRRLAWQTAPRWATPFLWLALMGG
ncbi:C39 family peptidase [Candidatus Dactylopiibacterium carminicum]|uniref:C39 family peptidase n=1 Tax=Candidatus Dactylopiibacterium carminicum TaxID=857335 RepID=UPI000BA9DAFE|nr:tetratricopeptide repeat protein [Candidatus Dactylopiibacterium carminicum]